MLNRKLSRRLMGLIITGVLLMPVMACADSYKDVDNATPQEIADGMGTKLTRGVANIATGWIEFPKQIYSTTKEDGWSRGLIVGPIKGIVMTLIRTATGAAEVVTFFSPYPGFYEPYFEPAYVWQKE